MLTGISIVFSAIRKSVAFAFWGCWTSSFSSLWALNSTVMSLQIRSSVQCFIARASGLQAVKSKLRLVNVILCDLQKFCLELLSINVSIRLFGKRSSSCHLTKPRHILTYLKAYKVGPAFELHNSQNHINPEIKS